MAAAPKKRRGGLRAPESIPGTPENGPRALLTTPPKKRGDWRFAQYDRAGVERL